jgi:polysaccharide deacetylase family protein (PEP-CTERM system associated)
MSPDKNPITNAMTVDVEDYLHVSAFEKYIRRDDWSDLPCRVERNTERVLDLFEERGVKATFFMLGWVAERYPHLVRRIVDSGHELASHGYSHVRVTDQNPVEFREDVVRTKHLLEDVAGRGVHGYRAASYSIGAKNLWALQVLEETGHRYSSSIYPIRHDLYGMPAAPRFPFYPHTDKGLLEIPITTVELFRQKLPCGGGGYFRLLPYRWSRWAMRRVNKRDRQPCVFYFHPWEIDPEQPRQRVGLKTWLRHYTNLERMEHRLRKLLAEFRWGRMDRVFLKPDDASRADAA